MSNEMPMCERTVQLCGGLVAQCDIGTTNLYVWPDTAEGVRLEASFPSYPELFGALKVLSLSTIGADFVSHVSAVSGESPPHWRTFSDGKHMCLNWDATQRWSQIRSAAYQSEDGVCFDLSSRIGYQLDSVNTRVRDISMSYRRLLKSLVASNDQEIGKRFQNGFTDMVYQAFHAFLFDACILRDYLCAFLYRYSSNGDLKQPGRTVTSAGSLEKNLAINQVTKPN